MYDNFFKFSKLIVVITFCLSLSSNGTAQDKRVVDSLQKLLESQKGKDNLDALIPLSLEYYDVDNKLALQYAEQAYQIATQYGDSARMVKSGRIRGQLLRRLDRLDESIGILSEVYPIAKRHGFIEDYKRILNALALSYTFKADYDKALDYNFQSLVIRESEGNKAEISIALNNIGLVYFKLKNYDRAIEYYTKSLNLKREANTNFDLDFLLINLGLCYNKIKGDPSKFLKAQEYINQALATCADSCSDKLKMPAYFGLGVSSFELKKFLEARNYFDESLKIARQRDDKRWKAENLVYLSQISIEQKDFEEAGKDLSEAEDISIKASFNQLLMDIYKQFSRLYNQTKDFKNASIYQDKYILLKDSLISEDLVKNVAKIQTNFEERENIATIATKGEIIKRQRWLNISIATIAVLSVLLIFVLYQGNKVKRKVNNALSDAKATIEEKNQQLEAANQNLEATVDARTHEIRVVNESLKRVNDELDNFIYKTSHDIRGPLASLKGMCNVALMDVKDPLALDYLTKLDDTAEKLNTILTRLLIINQINNASPHFELIDFNNIVEDVMMLEKKKGLPPRFSIQKSIGRDIEFYSDKELVRIILENLIDNAIKFHNDSERVEPFADIKIRKNKDTLNISVVDNGIGVSEVNPNKLFQMFSRASERSGTGGIGLYLTRSATEKLGGRVNLKTTPEGYTEFYVEFSLK